MTDDILTRDTDGNLAVRTVSSTGDNYVNPDDVYTRDSDGKLCVRITGQGGGGDQHNLGYFATQAALEEAYPTATAGDWAIVGATDTVWIWDTDNNEWVDSDQKPGSEIEWVAKVDLPASSGLGWEACPKYTVAGGIPDGRYSFYFRTKALNNEFVVDLMYKVNFVKNGDNIQGTCMPVINGDFFPENNYKLNEVTFNTVFWHNTINDDFVIYKQEIPFATNAAVFYPDMAVPECFAISNIVNVDTGVEYVPTGILNDRSYDDLSAYNSSLFQTKIDATDQQKTSYAYGGSTFDDLNQYVLFNGHYMSLKSQVSSITNFWVSLKIDQGTESGEAYIEIKNECSKPIVRIIKATDSLANIQVGFDQNNYLAIKLNTPTGSTGHISWLAGSAGYNDTFYVNVGEASTFTPVGILTVGQPINGDNFGAIEQYKGDTNANYTNGYFYKATGTETIIPESTNPTIDQSFPFDDYTVTIAVSNLIADMNNEVSWGVAYFAERLENPNAIIYINYTIENGQDPVIQSVMFEGATFTTPAVLSHFALTRVNKDSSGNGQMVVYPHYTPEHAEYTNTSWEQINVQPASAISTPATMPELTVAGWVNNIQTVNVDGVTTDNAVFVSPAPASVADYNAAGVVCTAQNNGTLTFTCTTTPSNAITVNVLIMG